MSIKPVDFQVMIPKTSEVSRIHQEGHNKSIGLMQQQSTATQNKAEESMKQVNKRDEVQEAKVREKQEKANGQGKKKKQNTKNTYTQQGMGNTEEDEQTITSTIDIKI